MNLPRSQCLVKGDWGAWGELPLGSVLSQPQNGPPAGRAGSRQRSVNRLRDAGCRGRSPPSQCERQWRGGARPHCARRTGGRCGSKAPRRGTSGCTRGKRGSPPCRRPSRRSQPGAGGPVRPRCRGSQSWRSGHSSTCAGSQGLAPHILCADRSQSTSLHPLFFVGLQAGSFRSFSVIWCFLHSFTIPAFQEACAPVNHTGRQADLLS